MAWEGATARSLDAWSESFDFFMTIVTNSSDPTLLIAISDVPPPGWNLVLLGVFVEFASGQTESIDEHLLSLRFLVGGKVDWEAAEGYWEQRSILGGKGFFVSFCCEDSLLLVLDSFKRTLILLTLR